MRPPLRSARRLVSVGLVPPRFYGPVGRFDDAVLGVGPGESGVVLFRRHEDPPSFASRRARSLSCSIPSSRLEPTEQRDRDSSSYNLWSTRGSHTFRAYFLRSPQMHRTGHGLFGTGSSVNNQRLLYFPLNWIRDRDCEGRKRSRGIRIAELSLAKYTYFRCLLVQRTHFL